MPHQQMSFKKLSLMFLSLTIIWLMCYQGQQQLSQRFQEDFINQLINQNYKKQPGRNITKKIIEMAQNIKNTVENKNNKIQSVKNVIKQYDDYLDMKYKLENNQQQENIKLNKKQSKTNPSKQSLHPICTIIRDFDPNDNYEQDLDMIKSIFTQQYPQQSIKVIYLSPQTNPTLARIKDYFKRQQISQKNYKILFSQADIIASLLLAVQSCPDNSIIMILSNSQYLISHKTFKLINQIFTTKTHLNTLYSNTLYPDSSLGISMSYPNHIISNKSYRKFPTQSSPIFFATQTPTFLKSYFVSNLAKFTSKTMIYPLWLPESYMLILMENSDNKENIMYLDEIIKISKKKRVFLNNRSEIEKQISMQIFKNEGIIDLIQNTNKK